MLIENEYLDFHYNIDQMMVSTAQIFLSLCFAVSSVLTVELYLKMEGGNVPVTSFHLVSYFIKLFQ